MYEALIDPEPPTGSAFNFNSPFCQINFAFLFNYVIGVGAYFVPMKSWLAFLVIISLVVPGSAQTNGSTLTYRNYTSIPAFPLQGLDGKKFSSVSAVQKGKVFVVVYFSPFCSHCQHFTDEITGHYNDFKQVQFLYVSAYPLEDIRTFANDRGLSKMKNFTLGFDPDFNMGKFYELKEIPGIFVYGKDGKLKKNYSSSIGVDELKEAVDM